MKIYDYDAVVIGTGCAGYNCADWLWDLGIVNIAMVTEGRCMGTSRNTGSDKQTYYKMSLAGDEGDSVLRMAKTLFEGGAMDGDTALAEAASSVRSFIKLANLGMPFPTNEYGEYVGYKTDHDPCSRATSIGPYTSKLMTEVLERSVLGKGIPLYDNHQVISLLKKDGRITGLVAIDTSRTDGVSYAVFRTPYVILATGGPAGIYADSVYPVSQTGSSGLALEAGAEMVNLSEWQYGLASVDFRWNVSGTYMQVLPRFISVDDDGVEREFLTEAFPDPADMWRAIFLKGYEWPFDVRKLRGSSYIDLLVYRETAIRGRRVYLDFLHNPAGLTGNFERLDETVAEYLKNSGALCGTPIERLEIMNPRAISLYADHGIDITREPLRIAVCAQHNNGGVRVDSNWQTNVEGLYVIGEAAGTLGVFRPGGSALNSCQVGGLRAAQHIAYSADNRVAEDFESVAADAVFRLDAFLEKTHRAGHATSQNLQGARREMSRNFAFLRNISDMEAGARTLEARYRDFDTENGWETPADIPALFRSRDTAAMQMAVSQAMLGAAKRYGSRGSAFVLEGDFMEREPVPENTAGREVQLVLRLGDTVELYETAVRPLPERDLWFERVWNAYNKKTERKG